MIQSNKGHRPIGVSRECVFWPIKSRVGRRQSPKADSELDLYFGSDVGVDRRTNGGRLMEWARILAYITGTVDQELLLRNEYLAAENRILRGQLKGRLKLSDAGRAKLGEIGRRLGRKALGEVGRAGRAAR